MMEDSALPINQAVMRTPLRSHCKLRAKFMLLMLIVTPPLRPCGVKAEGASGQ